MMSSQKGKTEQVRTAWMRRSGIYSKGAILGIYSKGAILLKPLLSTLTHRQTVHCQCVCAGDFFVLSWSFAAQSESTAWVVLNGKSQIGQLVVLDRLINYLVNAVPFASIAPSCARADPSEKVFRLFSLPPCSSLWASPTVIRMGSVFRLFSPVKVWCQLSSPV